MKKITAVILILAFLAVSVPVFADFQKDVAVEDDIVAARPLGILSIVTGAALWVLALPFAVISGSVPQTTETLISNPVRYTFARPIGDFDYEPAPLRQDDSAQKTD